MKRMLSLILCAVLVLGLTGCQKKEEKQPEMNGDFRYATWGMSKDEVKALEPGTLFSETEEGIMYDGIKYDGVTRDNADVNAVYIFEQDRFTTGMYAFKDNYTDKSLYMEDYDHLKEDLTGLYGEPVTDKQHWLSDAYRKVATDDQLGDMVAKGYLMCYAEWTTETLHITLILQGSEGECKILLSYGQKSEESEEKLQVVDTTGYQSARDYQLYVEKPKDYEEEFVYLKGTIKSTDVEAALVFQDEKGNPWLGVLTDPLSNREILHEGDKVTFFGRVVKWPPMENAISMMVFKIDKDGEVLHVKESGGSTYEEIFFYNRQIQ